MGEETTVRQNAGMTLLEVMIGVIIFMVVLGATAQALISFYVAQHAQHQRLAVAENAKSILSEMRHVRDTNGMRSLSRNHLKNKAAIPPVVAPRDMFRTGVRRQRYTVMTWPNIQCRNPEFNLAPAACLNRWHRQHHMVRVGAEDIVAQPILEQEMQRQPGGRFVLAGMPHQWPVPRRKHCLSSVRPPTRSRRCGWNDPSARSARRRAPASQLGRRPGPSRPRGIPARG